MEKQRHNSKEHNTTNTFDRFFSKARGVNLFPEEKSHILHTIENMPIELQLEPALIPVKRKGAKAAKK